MKRSTHRILTTHVGSLPRPPDLIALLKQRQTGEAYDRETFDRCVRQAVQQTVCKQAELGIDVVDDGEMSKIGFIPYVNERLTGIESKFWGENEDLWGRSREVLAFPDYYESVARQAEAAGVRHRHKGTGNLRRVATGPIRYQGWAALKVDIDNLKAALRNAEVEEAFMPAISVGNLADWQRNEYYQSDEEYLYAIADAMHEEYKAIVDAGLLLQVDDPILATYYIQRPDLSIAEIRKWAIARVEALNHALSGIPRDKVRYHTCYSINTGPRAQDMEAKHILDIMLRVNAGAYSFEAANPRHEHEWELWRTLKLPDDAVIIPGVITHSTPLIEHQELVAQRLIRFAEVVGRERVIAGADCGFASFATSRESHSTIVWAKFQALVEGARIASQQLWN
jgi:5-methyltetrahydropteroyltriglutamate--homocysteine methyltransferase